MSWIDLNMKSALDEKQIDARLYKKRKQGLEVHLREVSELDDIINAPERFSGYNIRVIHSPISHLGGKDKHMELQDILVNDHCDLFNELFEKVGQCCEALDKDLILVLHSSITVGHISPSEVSCLRLRLSMLLHMYPRITVGIENSTPIQSSKGVHKVNPNVGLAPVEMCKALGIERVGTVLDICHLMIEQYQYKRAGLVPITLYEVMKGYADSCVLMHVCARKGNGFDEHGMPFEERDLGYLRGVVELYRKFNYDCSMTLEVRENDYLNQLNCFKIELQVRRAEVECNMKK